jgi:hypothetical protein
MKAARRTCAKGKHRWTLDGGRRCATCGTKRTRMPKASKTPPLVRLSYEREGACVYCEQCKRPLKKGDLCGWWLVPSRNGRTRRTIYCSECHHMNVKRGKALPG